MIPVGRRFAGLVIGAVIAAGCSSTDLGSTTGSSPPARTPLFTRTTGGVTIRASEEVGRSAVAIDLSNGAAVALAGATDQSPATGDDLAVVNSSIFGVEESVPASWFAVRAPARAATVRVRFSDGSTDEMAPRHRWAVLARSGVASTGSVQAIDADGRVIASVPTPALVPCDPPEESQPTCSVEFPGAYRRFALRVVHGVQVGGYLLDAAGLFAVAEVSTDSLVKVVQAPLGVRPKGARLTVVAAEGQSVGNPAKPPAVIVAFVGGGVTTVRVRFLDGTTDEATPADGWVVLVNPGSELGSTVQALDSSGLVLAEQTVTHGLPLRM
jgi:hypothetical protein